MSIAIHGTDDVGNSTDRVVRTTVLAGASRTLTAHELEAGGSGLDGRLGDGKGKWRLVVESDGPIQVMSLLSSPTGHLTNLSSVPVAAGGSHRVALFPSASDPNGQGFVRVINRSEEAGEVGIAAIDDFGVKRGELALAIGALGAAHFNSDDLELGNPEKGLTGSTGAGNGDWRLELTSELDLEVLSFIRTADGFLTSMHEVVSIEGQRHRVPIFNPARNVNQVSRLRLVNLGEENADVAIVGVDDRGEITTPLQASILPGAARTFTAADLESAFTTNSLLPPLGKWRLWVESRDPTGSLIGPFSDLRQPILAMSLLESPTGHLTNLSSVKRCAADIGFREAMADGGEGPEMVVLPTGRFEMGCRTDDCGEAAQPVHEVSFEQPFSLSRTEVTFAQWDALRRGRRMQRLRSPGSALGTRRPARDLCGSGRCRGLCSVVVRTDRRRLSAAERGGMGVRGTWGWLHAVQLGRRGWRRQGELRWMRRTLGRAFRGAAIPSTGRHSAGGDVRRERLLPA